MTLDDTKAQSLAVIRVQLAQQAANVCPCGVQPKHCAEHGATKTETKERR